MPAFMDIEILTRKELIFHFQKEILEDIERLNEYLGRMEIPNPTPEEQRFHAECLATDFAGMYSLVESRKRQQIKPNKRKRIFERSKGVCELIGCNELISQDKELHHIIPENLGGSKGEDNLVMLCDGCHDIINKFQQKCRVEVCRLLFKNHTEKSEKTKQQIEELQKEFFNRFKFKPNQ